MKKVVFAFLFIFAGGPVFSQDSLKNPSSFAQAAELPVCKYRGYGGFGIHTYVDDCHYVKYGEGNYGVEKFLRVGCKLSLKEGIQAVADVFAKLATEKQCRLEPQECKAGLKKHVENWGYPREGRWNHGAIEFTYAYISIGNGRSFGHLSRPDDGVQIVWSPKRTKAACYHVGQSVPGKCRNYPLEVDTAEALAEAQDGLQYLINQGVCHP